MDLHHTDECPFLHGRDCDCGAEELITLADVEKQLEFRHISHLTVRYSEQMFVLSVMEYPQLRVTGRTLGEAFYNLCVADNRRVRELKNRPPQDLDRARRDVVRTATAPCREESYEERHARILRTYSPEAIPEACAALDKEFGR